MNMTGQSIECKAAVAWSPNEPPSVETVLVAPPKKGEVRIKIEFTSVCRSDISFLKNQTGIQIKFPCILGHEGAGIIESVGEGVSAEYKIGDRVVPLYIPQCMECSLCKHSKTNICKSFDLAAGTQLDGTTRFTCKGKKVYQFLRISTFSEYTVVNETAIAKLGDTVPLDRACLLGCGISTGFGAAINSANVQQNDTVAIFGLGTVGMAVVAGAKKCKAKRIIGIDLDDDKFEMGKVFGLTDFINPNKQLNPNKPVSEIIRELSDGGVDHAFDCVGNVDLMEMAFESTNIAWGQAIAIGVPALSDKIKIPFLDLIGGRKLIGSIFGGWKGRDAINNLMKQYLKGELMIDEFITHKLGSLDYINEAFQLLDTGKCLRCVISVK